MDTKKLKQKILDLAIRGKLVPQDPSDEPASVLLERIRTEKEQLIKDKKIKRDKNESYIYRSGKSYYEKRGDKTVCIDDEIPFEIPESWEWCRVRDISQSYIGLTYKPTDVSNNGTIVLRSSNIANGKLVFNDLVRVTCDISEKLQVENNDIIICARNGSRRLVGKSAIIYGISEKMTFGAFMAICKSKLYKYVYHYLQSQLFFDQLFFVSGTTTIYQLTQARFNDFLIPIPPINEQIAIVSKLEQLNGYIDRLNLDAGDLKNIIKQTKTKILDLAIRGKLVPQDPTDEPASVLLERIKAEKTAKTKLSKRGTKTTTTTSDNSHYENVPFDIPDSWVWTTIENVLEVNMGQSPDGSFVSSEFFSGMEFHQGKTFFSDKYLSVSNIKTTKPNKIAPRNSILLCVRAPVGVVNITPRTICIGRGLSSISSQFGMDADFIYYWLYTFSDSFNEKATGSTFTAISGEIIKNTFFPLPPLCEQTRITRKIIDIFSTLKDIEASLL